MLFVVAHRKVLQPRCSPAAAVLPRHGKAPVQGIWIQAEASPVPAFNFHWHHACYGWRVEFIFARARQPIMASNHRWRSPFRGSRRESAVAHLPKDVQGTVVRPPCPHNFSNLLNCPSGQRDDEIGQ